MTKVFALLGCKNWDDILVRPITPFGMAGIVFIIAGIVVICRGMDSASRLTYPFPTRKVDRATNPVRFWLTVSTYFLLGIFFIIVGIVKTLKGEVY